MSEGDMTCKEVVEIVSDYLEDALSAQDRARFEAHLAGCAGCTTYVEQMREIDPPDRHADRGAGSRRASRTPPSGVP